MSNQIPSGMAHVCDYEQEYLQSGGELSMRMVMDAQLECLSNRQLATELHRKVVAEFNVIADAARQTELAVWFGPRSLQSYYQSSDKRGHSFSCQDFKAMLWGSAGRVLLTVQDAHKKGDMEAKFGGANITLIFDETAIHPRGGIQGIAGTKEECLGLLKAIRESELEFVADPEVTVA